MKKRWLGIRVAAGLCAALGWWGLLYPELALTPDTVKISVEDEDGTLSAPSQEWSFDSPLYLDLLSAERSQITVRSRLLTELKSFWEAFHERDAAETK